MSRARLAALVHHWLLLLLVLAYLAAALWPAPGLWLRGLAFPEVRLGGEAPCRVGLPQLLLAALLFNAGLGVQASRLRALVHRPAG